MSLFEELKFKFFAPEVFEGEFEYFTKKELEHELSGILEKVTPYGMVFEQASLKMMDTNTNESYIKSGVLRDSRTNFITTTLKKINAIKITISTSRLNFDVLVYKTEGIIKIKYGCCTPNGWFMERWLTNFPERANVLFSSKGVPLLEEDRGGFTYCETDGSLKLRDKGSESVLHIFQKNNESSGGVIDSWQLTNFIAETIKENYQYELKVITDNSYSIQINYTEGRVQTPATLMLRKILNIKSFRKKENKRDGEGFLITYGDEIQLINKGLCYVRFDFPFPECISSGFKFIEITAENGFSVDFKKNTKFDTECDLFSVMRDD